MADDLADVAEGTESQDTNESMPSSGNDGTGGVEPGETEDAQPETAEQAQPAAPAWTPPSREEVDALRKQAEYGSRYAPYAQHIDAMIARGFQAPQAQVSQEAPAEPAKNSDEYDRLFGTTKGYNELLTAFNTDPRAFVGAIKAAVGKHFGSQFEKVTALEKKAADLERLLNAARGQQVLFAKRFQETPEWKASGQRFIDLLNEGKVLDPDLAWDIAVKQAKAAGATPAQAQAAGNAAASKAAANASAPKPAPARKSSPRVEPALQESKGRHVAEPAQAFNAKNAKHFGRDVMASAWAKAERARK